MTARDTSAWPGAGTGKMVVAITSRRTDLLVLAMVLPVLVWYCITWQVSRVLFRVIEEEREMVW